jgi:hypothetical protein
LTRRVDTPPAQESPIEYEVIERRVFGLAPNVLAATLAAAALATSIVLAALGDLAAGLLLLVTALLLGALFVEQARRRRAGALDRVAAAAADHSVALAGFAGASARAWTSAGREVARLRVEAHRLARERSQLQYALGGAAYRGDAEETATLRARLAETDGRIADCTHRARAMVEGARRVTAGERLAISRTQIRPPRRAPR